MIGPDHTVEDVLRLILDRAAFLKHFGDSAAVAVSRAAAPDARALSGLADACEELESWTCAVCDALGVEALGVQIGSKRRRGGAKS